MDLASRDSYIQKLASKVVSQREQEPKKKPFAHFKGTNANGTAKKKKKPKKRNFKEKDTGVKSPPPKAQQQKSPASTKQAEKGSAKQTSPGTKSINGSSLQAPKGGKQSSFSTVDILRKRLHDKIEESRGQGQPKDASSDAVQAKRAKRKLERERKKRKRKEFRMKQLAEKSGQEQQPEIKQEEEAAPAPSKRSQTAIIYNTVEAVDQGFVDKQQKKKNKKKSIKGGITPLTGKNYKQLLERVEARKTKLEQVREKDAGKARQMEEKMKWTNLLYKAEGIKIKDDENMLQASLNRKQKRHEQKKKKWTKLSENVVEKMQKRQDKRRKNILKRKQTKVDKKKQKARKKGRVLPGDLKKAAV